MVVAETAQRAIRNPKLGKRWLLGNIKGTASFLVLFTLVLSLNFLQMLSLTVRPFSLKAFRRLNRWCANSFWGTSLWWAENLYGIQVTTTGDDVPHLENAIVVANHQQMPDIVLLWTLAIKRGRLGDMKWFVKDVIKYVPGVGWGMLFLDNLFVKRDWYSDQEKIQRTFSKYRTHQIPIWLISFVEGTRLTPSKLARSQKYAGKQGISPLRHVLIPRTKGFTASVQGLRDYVTAVYDVTIGYPDGIPSLAQFAKGYAPRFHLHLRRYPIAEIPKDPEAISAWLMDRFKEKDQLLADYYGGQFRFPGKTIENSSLR